MVRSKSDQNTTIITLIRACYGRFRSFCPARLGMQNITELYQFVLLNSMEGIITPRKQFL